MQLSKFILSSRPPDVVLDCASVPLKLGLQMDSPNSRQTRKSHADPSLLDSTSFRHGSSAEVRGRPDSPPSLIRKSETIEEVAQSMERRGGAARQDGISLAESHDCSVRHRVDASCAAYTTVGSTGSILFARDGFG